MSLGDGVKLLGGFDLNSNKPIDNRLYCKTIDERNSLSDNNTVYPSMLVYVEATNETYVYKTDASGDKSWSIVDWEAQGITNYNQLQEPPIICADLETITSNDKVSGQWYCHKGADTTINGVKIYNNRIYQYDGNTFIELTTSCSTSDTTETNVIQYITISMPSGSTSGTLTSEQWGILQKSNSNYIVLKYTSESDVEYELYYLNDKDHTPGIWVYTHNGFNEVGKVKHLSLTTSTMAFTLSEYEYNTKMYWHNITAKYENDTSATYIRCLINMQFISDDSTECATASKLITGLEKYFKSSGKSYLPIFGEYRAYSATNVSNLTEWRFLNIVSVQTSDSGSSSFVFNTNAFVNGTLNLSTSQLTVVGSNVVEIYGSPKYSSESYLPTTFTLLVGSINIDGSTNSVSTVTLNFNEDYIFNEISLIEKNISYFTDKNVTGYYFASSYNDLASNSFLLANGNLSQKIRFTINEISLAINMIGEDFTVVWESSGGVVPTAEIWLVGSN